MKNFLTVLLLCIVFTACAEKNLTKYVEDIKEEVSLDPVFQTDHLDFNGTEIPISKFKKILPYNDTALVFVNRREKLVYITGLNLKVNKFIDLKEKYDSLFKPGIDDAYIYKDTLFLSANLTELHKLVLPENKFISIHLAASPMGSPYSLYIKENGNYVITFRGLGGDSYFDSYMKLPNDKQINNERTLLMKKDKEKFAGRDFIIGAEVTPGGAFVKFLRADKDYYGHDFGDSDEAFYFENKNRKFLYFKISKNILFFDEKENPLYRKESIIKKDWYKPRRNEQKNLEFYGLNDQPMISYANCFLQETIPNKTSNAEQINVYDIEFNPKFRIVLKGTSGKFGYTSLVCGSKLIIYSPYNGDKTLYAFSLDKINWNK